MNTLNLDNDSTLQQAVNRISSSECKNFAVFFNIAQATSTLDLSFDSLSSWQKLHVPESGVRWYNFWVDHHQRPLIEHLAKQYDVSPRLLGFLCPGDSSDIQKSYVSEPESDDGLDKPITKPLGSDDIEKATSVHIHEQNPSTPDAETILERLGVADVVENLWHFCTIDWGRRYVYIGINALSSVSGSKQSTSSDLPSSQRLWTSLLLCDDGTVISTCERPETQDTDALTIAAHKVARRHVTSIFKRLARASAAGASRSNDLASVFIRPEISATHFSVAEASSLLLYYLFDDWMTTYSLIARIEHPYRKRLEQVRKDLTKDPDVKALETLHRIGRQLTVLKQVYRSYAQVISRLLYRYRLQARNPNSPLLTQIDTNQIAGTSVGTYHDPMSIHEADPDQGLVNSQSPLVSSGIHLSTSALMRFERLLDRIHLYALNEIEQCLDEKESMVFMAFNLLTLSESRTIERLTRVTVVLAKATIIFLPVSLLTAYFSIQVGNIGNIYSLKTYWLSFMVVLVLSILFLVVYGIKTKTLGFGFRSNVRVREILSQKQKRG